VKTLLPEYKTLLKEIKGHLNKWQISHVHGFEHLTLFGVGFPPKQSVDLIQCVSKLK
jgi:hypothetical protein